MKRHIYLKITSIVIMLSLLMTSMPISSVFAEENINRYHQIMSIENKDVEITAFDVECGRKIVIEKKDKKYEIIINNQAEEVTTTEYSYVGKSFFGTKKYEEKKSNVISTKEKNIGELISQISWNSKTRCKWCNNYYYCWGTSKYGNTYLKIGCKANYKIKYYSLASWKKDMCKNDYVGNIKKSNTAYNKALAFGTAADITASGAVIAAIGGPVKFVVTAICSAVGAGATFANYVIEAHDYSGDAAEAYELIKKMGKKI